MAALILSGLAMQVGATLIVLGLKVVSPEISKVIDIAEIEEAGKRMNLKRVGETALEAVRKARLKSK